jgi:hypothetical protein
LINISSFLETQGFLKENNLGCNNTSALLCSAAATVLGTFIKEVKKLSGASEKYCWLWMGAAS